MKFTEKPLNLESLEGGTFMHMRVEGKTLTERNKKYNDYIESRKENGVYPFSRTSSSRLLNEVYVTNSWADESKPCINFGSQDYLGLCNHPKVIQAAKDTIEEFGINAGGTPVLGGRNILTNKLEEKIASVLGVDQAQVYPSGWSACFGAIAGLVTHKDYIVMDMLMHNSSDVAARYATENVYKFKHNSLEDLEKKLKFCKEKVGNQAIFVLVESLYSMNSDGPDLEGVYKLCRQFEAILIVDITHDFGCMGDSGLGLLETVNPATMEDTIFMGSMSKCLANPGGFIAGPMSIRNRIEGFSPCYTFASSISTIACGISYAALEVAFSEEGKMLRRELMKKINLTIDELNKRGFVTNGIPSPIIPVLIGELRLTRLLSREIIRRGLIANLVEFPAVPRDKSIIRFQMMGGMSDELIIRSCDILKEAIEESQRILLEAKIDAINIAP